ADAPRPASGRPPTTSDPADPLGRRAGRRRRETRHQPAVRWSSVSTREALRELIVAKAVIRGPVVLSSGKQADYYVDMRRMTMEAHAAPMVGEVMLDLTADLDYAAAGGLTLGADPIAFSMLHVAHAHGRALDAFVVRKAEKTHGMGR